MSALYGLALLALLFLTLAGGWPMPAGTRARISRRLEQPPDLADIVFFAGVVIAAVDGSGLWALALFALASVRPRPVDHRVARLGGGAS